MTEYFNTTFEEKGITDGNFLETSVVVNAILIVILAEMYHNEEMQEKLSQFL